MTGRKLPPALDPFAPPSFYTAAEERALALDAIASLPDRSGHFWLKSRSPEAFLIRTRTLDIPTASALDLTIASLRNDPTFGYRVSRKEYERLIAARKRAAQTDPTKGADAIESLTEAYRRTRHSSEPEDGISPEPNPLKRPSARRRGGQHA